MTITWRFATAAFAMVTLALAGVPFDSGRAQAAPDQTAVRPADIVIDPTRIDHPMPDQPLNDRATPSVPTVQPAIATTVPDTSAASDGASPPEHAGSLRELVDAQDVTTPLDEQENCLAGAVYFESKGESLAGQLAVARVIIARTHSPRFPGTPCGVVFQRSQFSFVRGGTMPAINHAGQAWKNAVAIARIAMAGTWPSPVEGALYFHATRVATAWHGANLGTVGHQVFYR